MSVFVGLKPHASTASRASGRRRWVLGDFLVVNGHPSVCLQGDMELGTKGLLGLFSWGLKPHASTASRAHWPGPKGIFLAFVFVDLSGTLPPLRLHGIARARA